MDGLHYKDGSIFPVRDGRGYPSYNLKTLKSLRWAGYGNVSAMFKNESRNNPCKYLRRLTPEETTPIVPAKVLI